MKTFTILFLFVCLCSFPSYGQSLFVGNGTEFHLKKDLPFTTSNTIVTLDPGGIFSVEAGSLWGSSTEYVNGQVSALGTGISTLPVGNNGVYAPVVADHTGNLQAAYFNSSPGSGGLGANVNAVSDVEYWELSGNAVITLPWNAASNMTDLVTNNGGVLNSIAIVGLDGGTWNLVSAPLTNAVTGDLTSGTVTSDASNEVNLSTYSQFTLGIDNEVVLGLDELFITNGIDIVHNPVRSAETIQFISENNLSELNAELYDITGKQIRTYNNIILLNGFGALDRTSIGGGIYFLKFIHQGKQGVKKIILE